MTSISARVISTVVTAAPEPEHEKSLGVSLSGGVVRVDHPSWGYDAPVAELSVRHRHLVRHSGRSWFAGSYIGGRATAAYGTLFDQKRINGALRFEGGIAFEFPFGASPFAAQVSGGPSIGWSHHFNGPRGGGGIIPGIQLRGGISVGPVELFTQLEGGAGLAATLTPKSCYAGLCFPHFGLDVFFEGKLTAGLEIRFDL